VVDHPRAGMHYPRSVGELQAWFPTDAACLDYLEWLRWPAGFVCPRCDHAGGWQLGDGRFECSGCQARRDLPRYSALRWFTSVHPWVCRHPDSLLAQGEDGEAA